MMTEKKSKKIKKVKTKPAKKSVVKKVVKPAHNTTPARQLDSSHGGGHSVAGGEEEKVGEEKKKEEKKEEKKEKYFAGIGRRKTAVAQVRLYSSKKDKVDFVVNEMPSEKYFPTLEQQIIVQQPLKLTKNLGKFSISIKVKGSGSKAQAEASRHGIARALLVWDSELKKKLKRAGFLKRDPRKVERKKPGLKKARRAPQWKKR
jgi:small subunit ribosomal protein S9